MSDLYWDNVVLALPMDGADGSTTFTDLKGKTVTPIGNAQISTALSKFGGSSAHFDGAGDYLSVPDSTDWAFGISDFTIETWVNLSVLPSTGTSGSSMQLIAHQRIDDSNRWFLGIADWTSPAIKGIWFHCDYTGTGFAFFASYTFLVNTWYHIAAVRAGTFLSIYVNGIKIATINSSANVGDINAPLAIGGGGNWGVFYFNGYIDDLRITKGVARYTANFTPPDISYFDEYFARIKILAAIQQDWNDANLAAASLDQPWSLKLGSDLVQPWSDATVLKGILAQHWSSAQVVRYSFLAIWRDVAVVQCALLQPWIGAGAVRSLLAQAWGDAGAVRTLLGQAWDDAGAVQAVLEQAWRDGRTVREMLEQPWSLQGPVQHLLAQVWSLAGDLVRQELEQCWSLRDVEPIMVILRQPWAIAGDAEVLRYTLAIEANGRPVRVSHLNIEADLDQDVLTCEIHPETEAEYLLCPEGTPLRVTLTSVAGVEVFVFLVTSTRIDEEHGGCRYIVEAMSPAVLLGPPYSEPMDGELSGVASALAESLLAGQFAHPFLWQTVDWAIPTATWIASGDTPLSLLKTLAGAVGAVVQSAPDGGLVIMPEYPVPVSQWKSATPDLVLTETLDCFTVGSTPDHRNGYNRYLVGDQMSAADGLRLEEVAISATVKEVRGYQTPWAGNTTLTHTGGDWVQIEDNGISERQVDEVVEIVQGSGRTQYPIYGRESVTWLQTNLGTVTYSEDGSVRTAVEGQSLLALTYTTRCRLWLVRDHKNEPLQLVAEI